MGMEKALADRKGKEPCELSKLKNGRPKKCRQRRKKTGSPVQNLFDTCKEVFAAGGVGVVPPPTDVERLRSVLDSMKPANLGIDPNMPYFKTSRTGRQPPIITYVHLHECEEYSVGIFFLPPSGVIPLHNHPGMTVFSKLLFGSMHIKSYDWADTSGDGISIPIGVGDRSDGNPPFRLAKVKVDSDFKFPCDTSILYPSAGGNMHRFTALSACAVLDVMGPPYSDPDGRHCQYYSAFPFGDIIAEGVSVPEEEGEGYAWLQEREKPEDYVVTGDVYRGPKFVVK